ncbi:MAG TPA: ABC transporter substrate-binding protein [Opitutus sp.]|nr:ABC transporter substrate-binding protein [Opitutus sp.]
MSQLSQCLLLAIDRRRTRRADVAPAPRSVFVVVVLLALLWPRLASGRVVVNYWEKWAGFEADAMQAVVDDFNRSQDRIEVHLLTISPIDVKLMLAASGGNPPDLAGLWEYNIPDFAEKGALLPLDDELKQAGLGPGHYIPAYWELGRFRGFTWALPSTPGCVALYYNKRLFREAGLDPDRPPRTFAEVEAMSRRLTRVELERNGRRVRVSFEDLAPAERDGGRYAIVQIGHQPNDVGGMNVSCWGYWFGAKYWDGDGHILANSPGNLAALQWLRDAMTTYGVNQMQDFAASYGMSQSAQSPFISGRAAMVMQGPWLVNFIEKYAPDLEWGVTAFPAAPGVADGAPMTLVISDMLVIPRGAKHPHEAFEFLRYTQRQDVAEKLARLQRKFTALREVSPSFFAHHPNPAIHFFADLARSPEARAVPRLTIWRDYDIEMTVAATDVRFLLKTPRAALDDVQKRVQWRFDRVMRRWNIVGDERLAEWRENEQW